VLEKGKSVAVVVAAVKGGNASSITILSLVSFVVAVATSSGGKAFGSCKGTGGGSQKYDVCPAG
jgi:hypothetical protein